MCDEVHVFARDSAIRIVSHFFSLSCLIILFVFGFFFRAGGTETSNGKQVPYCLREVRNDERHDTDTKIFSRLSLLKQDALHDIDDL